MTINIKWKDIQINSNKDIEKAMETLMLLYKVNQWRRDIENWDFQDLDIVFAKYE